MAPVLVWNVTLSLLILNYLPLCYHTGDLLSHNHRQPSLSSSVITVIVETFISLPLKAHLIGCWQNLGTVCFWQPIPSGLNLVVAAVLRDSL